MIQTINPYSETVIETFHSLKEEQIEAKLNEASLAAKFLRSQRIEQALHQRIQLLLGIERTLLTHEKEIAEKISTEMGKPIVESLAEVRKSASVFSHYAKVSEDYLNFKVHLVGSAALMQWQSIGAIFAVMPWNFPLWQVCRVLAPAIVMGNPILLKHAEITWGTAVLFNRLVKQVCDELGQVRCLFNLQIKEDQAERVIADPRVSAVTFTGSRRGGSAVAGLAGRYLKKSVLELGGNDPSLVLESADLDKAAKAIVRSRFINTGQSCIATKRVLAQDSIADALAEKIIFYSEQLDFGDPLNTSTSLGPLAHSKFAPLLEKQSEQLLAVGGEIIFEKMPVLQSSAHSSMQIVRMPRWEESLANEEIFGPKLPIYHFHSVEEAIRICNATPFGLGAAIYGHDRKQLIQIGEELQVGIVALNDFVKSEPGLPFGGVKDSGYGRELGQLGLFEFVNAKVLVG